jgi:hypothetical protein
VAGREKENRCDEEGNEEKDRRRKTEEKKKGIYCFHTHAEYVS